MNWTRIIEETKYSVLELEAHNNVKSDCLKPYSPGSIEISYGNGFIFDIENGLILTDSSLVYNNTIIRGRSEIDSSRCLRLNLFCICANYGFAICQMREEDKKYLQDRVSSPEKLDVDIQCDLIQNVGQEVLILGSQQNIVSAHISKWQTSIDTYRRLSMNTELNYIGSPLFNKSGKCLGLLIKRQSSYKCLLMHTIINIYPLVSKIGIIDEFKLGLSWSSTSEDFVKRFIFNNDVSEISGIYINKLQPGTFMSELNNEDILMSISYTDNLVKKTGKFKELVDGLNKDSNKNITLAASSTSASTLAGVSTNNLYEDIGVIAIIDKSGQVDLYYKQDDQVGDRFISHKIKLNELLRLIPYDSTISTTICRNGILNEIKIPIVYRPAYKIGKLQIQYRPCDFEIVAGMCLSVLNLNQVEKLNCPHLYNFSHGNNKYIPYLVITHIYSDSTLYDVGVFKIGDIIMKINGHVLQNIDQLRQLLVRQPSGLEFINHRDKKYYITRDRSAMEDQNTIKSENIRGLIYHW